MGRRVQTTTQDPDVEAAQKNTEAAAAETTRLQKEAEGLGSVKAGLEKAIDDRKGQMDEELAQYRAVIDRKKLELDHELTLLKGKKDKFEADMAPLEAHVATFTAKKEDLDKAIVELKKVKEVLETDISRLKKEKAELEPVVSGLKAEEQALTDKKIALDRYIRQISAEINVLVEGKAELFRKVGDARDEDVRLEGKKSLLEDQIVGLEASVKSKREEFELASNSLLAVQAKKVEHEADMQKREGEIHEKMGNLSRLEGHVAEKMELFKEAKSLFTSEQLLRMGIKD